MFISYAAYFFTYSFVGWAWEVLAVLVTTGKLVNRGFFLGPLCPIYGVSVLAIVLILGKIHTNPLIVFLAGAAIITAVELITGFLLEKIFHTRWWDYSQFRFNFHGYIALEISLLWGLFAVLVIEIIHPFISNFIAQIPLSILRPLVIVVLCLFTADMCMTVFRMFRLRTLLDTAAATAREIKAALEAQISRIESEEAARMKHAQQTLSEQYERQIETIRYEFTRWFMANPSVKSVRYAEQITKLKQHMYTLHKKTGKGKKPGKKDKKAS